MVSHGVRRDAEIILVLLGPGGPRTVRIEGATIRSLNPDERSTVALLSRALSAMDVGTHESGPLPGFHVSARGLDVALEAAAHQGPVVHLTEEATTDLESWRAHTDAATWVLSDHRDPTPEERALIERFETQRVTLGPMSLQADQCVVIVHNRLDRLSASEKR